MNYETKQLERVPRVPERFSFVCNRSGREPYQILDSNKDEIIATLYDIEWAEFVCNLLNNDGGERDDV